MEVQEHKIAISDARYFQLIEWRRYKEAIQEAEEIIRLSPDEGRGYALLAQAYLKLGEKEKALVWSQEALRRDPEHEVAWFV